LFRSLARSHAESLDATCDWNRFISVLKYVGSL
jgi:hypothetical protein